MPGEKGESTQGVSVGVVQGWAEKESVWGRVVSAGAKKPRKMKLGSSREEIGWSLYVTLKGPAFSPVGSGRSGDCVAML